jgi:lysophospholipase
MEQTLKLFLVLFLYSVGSFAVDEANFGQIYHVLNQANNFSSKYFEGRKGLKVNYIKYGQETGTRGSVLVSAGRTEMAEKFLELAYDLNKLGFSPIYITTHRGQGKSDRGINHAYKGYVRKFRYYSDDLNTLATLIKNENKNSKLYLIGHSMGGAVGVEYLERFESVFTKAAFTSPMLQIYFSGESSESSALKDTALACFIPFRPYCTSYVPGGGNPNRNPEFEGNDVTSSKTRFEFKKELFKLYPKAMVGSATIRWVRESIFAGRSMRATKNMNKISTPFLMFVAQKDTVVDNTGLLSACSKTIKCESTIIQDALHNLFMERDELRTPIINKIDRFFN